MRYCLWLLLFSGSFWYACRFSDASPEDVALRWQDSVDKNKFTEARALSANQALRYVNMLDSITGSDTTQVSHTDLLQLQCAVMDDRAVCAYFVEDETGEKHPDTMILRQVKGRWIVDKVGGFEQVVNDTIDPGEGPALFPKDSTPALDE